MVIEDHRGSERAELVGVGGAGGERGRNMAFSL